MGGTGSEARKRALYRSLINSRNGPESIIFQHFPLATVLNAHILYKLKNLIQAAIILTILVNGLKRLLLK